MGETKNVREYGFKDKELRETKDVELLRSAYEDLLRAYQEEIKKRVILELKLEEADYAVEA